MLVHVTSNYISRNMTGVLNSGTGQGQPGFRLPSTYTCRQYGAEGRMWRYICILYRVLYVLIRNITYVVHTYVTCTLLTLHLLYVCIISNFNVLPKWLGP